MANQPVPELVFAPGCPDCAARTVELPPPLPTLGDDFDWAVRDYDGFRAFMLQELMASYPERSQWTEADMEVVLVELLAAKLDQLSDMLDRVTSEAYLETARRPESVRRLLHFIGYNPEEEAGLDPAPSAAELELIWSRQPSLMEQARRAGPRSVQQQRRMVTPQDYASELALHPLVIGATAWVEWGGAWSTIRIAVIGWEGHGLDEVGLSYGPVQTAVQDFETAHGLAEVNLTITTSIRSVLTPYLEAYRMAGQEAVLQDAGVVGITMALSVQVDVDYFQSEIRDAIRGSLAQFFAPGGLRFGQDLHESDILKLLTSIDGVDDACLNRFKRVGSQFPDDTVSGLIAIGPTEIAACDNDPAHPDRGYYSLTLHGGQRG